MKYIKQGITSARFRSAKQKPVDKVSISSKNAGSRGSYSFKVVAKAVNKIGRFKGIK